MHGVSIKLGFEGNKNKIMTTKLQMVLPLRLFLVRVTSGTVHGTKNNLRGEVKFRTSFWTFVG